MVQHRWRGVHRRNEAEQSVSLERTGLFIQYLGSDGCMEGVVQAEVKAQG